VSHQSGPLGDSSDGQNLVGTLDVLRLRPVGAVKGNQTGFDGFLYGEGRDSSCRLFGWGHEAGSGRIARLYLALVLHRGCAWPL